MPTLSPRARDAVLVAALVFISLGGGGLVTALDHPVGDATRPELTARSDALVGRRLALVREPGARAQREVDALTDTARDVLTALPRLDAAAVRARLPEGDTSVAGIEAALGALRAARVEVVAGVDVERLSERNRGRLARIDEAVTSLTAVAGAWTSLAAAAAIGVDLLERLQAHDRLTFEATEAGRDEAFAVALRRLDEAADVLAGVDRLREALEDEVDLATLDGWLVRARDYDAALRRLYELVRETGGEVTDEVREANEAVDRTQAALAPDTTALSVIVSDVAGAPVTEAFVSIETARGSLAAAIAALD
jgi:hypothetical protein